MIRSSSAHTHKHTHSHIFIIHTSYNAGLHLNIPTHTNSRTNSHSAILALRCIHTKHTHLSPCILYIYIHLSHIMPTQAFSVMLAHILSYHTHLHTCKRTRALHTTSCTLISLYTHLHKHTQVHPLLSLTILKCKYVCMMTHKHSQKFKTHSLYTHYVHLLPCLLQITICDRPVLL